MSHNSAAASVPLIGIREKEGFQVYSLSNPENSYQVTGTYERPACTCPDFDEGCGDPAFRCRHIHAVEHQLPREETPTRKEGGTRSRNGRKGAGNGSAGKREVRPESISYPSPVSVHPNPEMLLKRSVSPDGRINSLSVEFSCPVDGLSTAEIVEKARRGLSLQEEITAHFLETAEALREDHGSKSWDGDGTARPRRMAVPDGIGKADEKEDAGAVPAKLRRIGEMNTRFGPRLFIDVVVGEETLKLFGSRKQLAEELVEAGYPREASRLTVGTDLNLPCRAVTVANGAYTNVERLLPPAPGRNSGNGGRR